MHCKVLGTVVNVQGPAAELELDTFPLKAQLLCDLQILEHLFFNMSSALNGSLSVLFV